MSASIQGSLSISTVYPNPFSTASSVVFQSPGLASVTLEVYDVSGRLVKSQELGAVSEGRQTVLWDGSSSSGETLSNGVYIIRLAGGSGSSATARVILLR
jgi:flagellar hook assembly protein FlgD